MDQVYREVLDQGEEFALVVATELSISDLDSPDAVQKCLASFG